MNNRKLDIPEVQQIPQFMKIMDDLSVGNNPYLVGSAGTGKTTIGEKVAYAGHSVSICASVYGLYRATKFGSNCASFRFE